MECMAKQIVTQEGVNQACEALIAEGIEPSIVAVQERIGGGSYTTVKKYLVEWKRQVEEEGNDIPVPDVILKKAAELARAVWVAGSNEANQRIAVIQENADKNIHALQTDLHQAQDEIVRLERVESEKNDTITELSQKLHIADIDIATLTIRANKADKLATELDAAKNEVIKKQVEIGKLTGEVETLRDQINNMLATFKK